MRSVVAAFLLLSALPLAARDRVARPVPVEIAPWLQQHAIALDAPPAFPLIAAIPRDARVIALGDGTHGTHEFLEFKRQLIPLLIDRYGVTTIAFEAPFGEWEAIRRYVLEGEGNLSELLASSDFFFWDTSEVVSFIEEVRSRNAAGSRIEIVGIDAWHPHSALDRVHALLGDADASLTAEVKSRYACLEAYRANPSRYTASARSGCRESVWSVLPLLEQNRPVLENALGDETLDRLLHAARVVEQGEEARGTRGANRDAAHAENISWLAARSPHAPVIVWGHNEHFGKLPYRLGEQPEQVSAGVRLAAEFGDRYFALATTALEGMFHASDLTRRPGLIGVHPLAPAASDDVASIVARDLRGAFYIPMRAAPAALRGELTMRAGGSNIASHESATVDVRSELGKKYDAIVWWRTTTPSQLRRWPLIE